MSLFLSTCVDAVRALLSRGVKLNPRVVIAQAVLESGWGESLLAKQHHNYFGLKAGTLWHGPVVSMSTREFVDGSEIVTEAVWRSYSSASEGFLDYVRFISSSEYFSGALNYVDDDERYLSELVDKDVKYATDPKYKAKILELITELHLTDTFPIKV